MRLIDADALIEILKEFKYHSFNLDDALNVIDSAPAVDTTAIENALLKRIYDELLAKSDTWPDYLADIFYRYLAERGLYHAEQ